MMTRVLMTTMLCFGIHIHPHQPVNLLLLYTLSCSVLFCGCAPSHNYTHWSGMVSCLPCCLPGWIGLCIIIVTVNNKIEIMKHHSRSHTRGGLPLDSVRSPTGKHIVRTGSGQKLQQQPVSVFNHHQSVDGE